MTEEQSAIRAVIEAVSQAWLEGRYNDIANYVHERVALVPPGGARPAAAIVGRDAFVQSYADFGASATIHSFEAGTSQIDDWGSTAVARCPFVIDYEIASGRYKEQGTDLLVLIQDASGWKICWRTMLSPATEDAT